MPEIDFFLHEVEIDRISVLKNQLQLLKVKDDWKFVAMVMDRMFLWIFTLAVFGNFSSS